MRNYDMPFDVELDESELVRMIGALEPGEAVAASMLLTVLEGDGEADAFEEMDLLGICLDISDLPRSFGNGESALRLRREAELAKREDMMSAFDKKDPLRIYLEEIASIPVCGDVHVLSEDLYAANRADREVPELYLKLLNLSLSRVVQIARGYTGYGVLMQDLIQEGSMSLWSCLPRLEEGDFEAVRDQIIHNAMKKAIILQAHADGVGGRMRQAMEDYRAVDERLLAELGRNATIEEIAEELHMSPEETEILKKAIDNARLLKQAKAEREPEEEEAEAQEEECHVEDTALFQMRQRILDLLSGLEETDAKLLTLRFGLEGGLPLNPEETGKKLGLTPEEVVAREAAALALLRRS